MLCRTGQICIVGPTVADNELHFFTISNLNYTVFVSLAHMFTTVQKYERKYIATLTKCVVEFFSRVP